MLSAWWLDIVIFQATAKPSRQGTANDNDPWCHAVLTPMKDVPYEDGSCQCGQKTGSDVQVTRPREVGVRSNAVESHQSNNQDKTCKKCEIFFLMSYSRIPIMARWHNPNGHESVKPFPSYYNMPYVFFNSCKHDGTCKDWIPKKQF